MSRIFISYSHRGRGPEWKAALLRALAVFEPQHLLDVWEDGKIRVSAYWEDDIEKAMDEAQLAIVLLTKEALESDFILTKELPCLRNRQQNDKLPVFPVICEPCDWVAHDWLRATQAPNASNPLSDLKPAEQDRVFRQLATNIAEALSLGAFAALSTADGHLPDEKIYLDRFPLTRGPGLREEKLIGREQELALLDLAFAQPYTAIVTLVAWGGVGKTMLVQHWFRRLESGRVHKDKPANPWFGARRVYAWSFFSQGTKEDRQASEDMFLAHALAWLGVQCEPTLSPWDKGRLLADAIAKEPTLLILDGIEPLQYPPGPMGGFLREVGEDESHLRAPGIQSLLKQLARKSEHGENASLCLVTTRVWLADLNQHKRSKDNPHGTVLRVELGNLIEEAGAALLYQAGVDHVGAQKIAPEKESDNDELLKASREVDGHALTLNLLGRFLARAHGGDIRRRDLVKFEDADRKEQGGTTFKMLAAFENWFAKSGDFGARQLAVLRILGLFDRPADAGCIAALRKPPVIVGLTDPLFTTRLDAGTGYTSMLPLLDEDWNTAISFLSDFGLIVIQTISDHGERMLDCHPLIREHFAKQISDKLPENWRAAHCRLYEHLRNATPDKPQPTLEELQPLYQSVAHGCKAQKTAEALEQIFWRRIQREDQWYAWKKLGAIGLDLAALAAFFQGGWERPFPSLCIADANFILNQAGQMLRSLGRTSESIRPLEMSFQLAVESGAFKQAAAGSSNLAEVYLTVGSFKEAADAGEVSVALADKSGDWFQREHDRTTYGIALHAAGRTEEALRIFQEAEKLHREYQPQLPWLYALRSFRYCDLILSDAERQAWSNNLDPNWSGFGDVSGKNAEVFSEVSKRGEYSFRLTTKEGWLLDAGLEHLTIGRVLIYQASMMPFFAKPVREAALNRAEHYFVEADQSLRKAKDAEYLPLVIMSRAWLRFLKGEAGGARADLDEAWDIAERGPMQLHLADIHLYRARLFFREQPYPWKSPQADLAAAEKLINDCGYHRRDEELADAKRAILS